MSEVIILDAQYAKDDKHWYKWLSAQLKLEGYDARNIDLPNIDEVSLDTWMAIIDDAIDQTYEEIYIVAHGLSTRGVLKFLEKTEAKHIQAVFLVSGFELIPEQYEIKNSQIKEGHINIERARAACPQFYSFCAKDDMYVPYTVSQDLSDRLNGKCYVYDTGGHFCTSDGYETFMDLKHIMLKQMSR